MVIKGYINIQRCETTPGRVSFYTGADIHLDEESAKKFASKNTIAQVYIAFETDPKIKREKDMTEFYAKKEETEERVQKRVREKSKRTYRKKES